MPNRTYVKFQALRRGKDASFLSHYIQSNSMSLGRFRQLYEVPTPSLDRFRQLYEARTDFIGMTKEMWEEGQERERELAQLNYGESLAEISDTLLRVTPAEDTEVGPTSEPER